MVGTPGCSWLNRNPIRALPDGRGDRWNEPAWPGGQRMADAQAGGGGTGLAPAPACQPQFPHQEFGLQTSSTQNQQDEKEPPSQREIPGPLQRRGSHIPHQAQVSKYPHPPLHPDRNRAGLRSAEERLAPRAPCRREGTDAAATASLSSESLPREEVAGEASPPPTPSGQATSNCGSLGPVVRTPPFNAGGAVCNPVRVFASWPKKKNKNIKDRQKHTAIFNENFIKKKGHRS